MRLARCAWPLLILSILAGCAGKSSPKLVAVPTPVWTQPEACRVKEITLIGPSVGGLDWSRAGDNRIVMGRYDENQVVQLYTMKPDGSELTCLTCTQVPGGPSVGVHKGVPHWHPSGKYIFLQVEQEKHPGAKALAAPGSGMHNDIWATTPDGSRWWRLTDYSGNPNSGILFPVPSHDGTKLAWAERYAPPAKPVQAVLGLLANKPTEDLWGKWRLNIADLVISPDGPRLENIRSYTPGDASFYEMQTWSPDDAEIYFSSSIRRTNVYLQGIWRMNVTTQALTPFSEDTALLDDRGNWEEHLSFSPDSRKIAYMSSECCPWDPNDLKTLRAELYLVDADGSNKVQLTHFNQPGYPESQTIPRVVAGNVWSPDGRQIAMQVIRLTKEYLAGTRTTDLWMLTFEGPCGAQ